VHQQRIDAALNEHKREAMHRLRDSLADPDKAVTARVLRNLEAYIRTEEKVEKKSRVVVEVMEVES